MATQMTTVELDKGLHQDARRYCAETGMKLKGVINKALSMYLAQDAVMRVLADAERRRKRRANA